ncbi:hypothetical protein [Leptospira adleri]|nr:hypothetical protein [Leptospira adleri]
MKEETSGLIVEDISSFFLVLREVYFRPFDKNPVFYNSFIGRA